MNLPEKLGTCTFEAYLSASTASSLPLELRTSKGESSTITLLLASMSMTSRLHRSKLFYSMLLALSHNILCKALTLSVRLSRPPRHANELDNTLVRYIPRHAPHADHTIVLQAIYSQVCIPLMTRRTSLHPFIPC